MARKLFKGMAAMMVMSMLYGETLAQDVVMSGVPLDGTTVQSSGSYYNHGLGTHLRAKYSTRSYGQLEGNLDIGAAKIIRHGNSSTFFDGQITLNDVSGIGFNLGIGQRFLSYNDALITDPQRMLGGSIWIDGTSTEADNFFPQLGISLESLGETWDFRANAYIPLTNATQTGDATLTGAKGYFQSNLVNNTIATRDNALTVLEGEIARRISQDKELWAFAGVYGMNGNEGLDATGFKLGLRGQALPDLFLQLAATDDKIYGTNLTFSMTWFVGRTRTNYQPHADLTDRFREPVLRNDYVAMHQNKILGGIPIQDTDGNNITVVHVNSSALAGGDGSFERPFDELSDASGVVGSIILAHAGSTFSNGSITLLDDQRLLGEGGGINHSVITATGTLNLPETITGALGLNRASIANTIAMDSINLARNNEVNNFDISGGTRAIVMNAADSGNPTLRNLAISNLTGNGIDLKAVERTDTSVTPNVDRVDFNTTIADIAFSNVSGNAIAIDADSGTVGTPTISETINITNVTVDATTGAGTGLALSNTHSGQTTTISNFNYNGGTTGTGGMVLTSIDGNVNVTTNSKVAGGNATAEGIRIVTNGENARIVFDSTTKINNAGGTGLAINGGAGKAGNTEITYQGTIDNTAGRAVTVENIGDADHRIFIAGNITDKGAQSAGIQIQNNTAGQINFTGNIDIDTSLVGNLNTGPAVDINGNSTAYSVTMSGGLKVKTSSQTAFRANSSVNLAVTGNENTLETTTGTALNLAGITVNNANISFKSVNVNGATNGIILNDNQGTGRVIIGSSTGAVGNGGTLVTTGDAIQINGRVKANINGVTINNSLAANGVTSTLLTNETDVTFAKLKVTTVNGDAINVAGMTSGAQLGFSDLDATVTGTGQGVRLNGLENGSNVRFSTLAVSTDTGTAFMAAGALASNRGTVRVSGTNNSVTSTNGTAIHMQNLKIDAAGVRFDTVSANASTGILLASLEGGQVRIGASGATSGATGTINGQVALTNVSEAVLEGLRVNVTSGSAIQYLVNNADTTDATIKFTMHGNELATTANSQAFNMVTNRTNVNTVTMLLDNNTFTNSGAAKTVLIASSLGTTLNATITGSTVTNNGAAGTGVNFELSSGGVAANVLFTGNTAVTTSGTDGTFELVQTAGPFLVKDLPGVDTANTGAADTVDTTTGTITDLGFGTVPTP